MTGQVAAQSTPLANGSAIQIANQKMQLAAGTTPKGKARPATVTQTLKRRSVTVRAAQADDAATLASIGAAGFAAAHKAAMQSGDLQELLDSAWNEQQLLEIIDNPEIQLFVAQVGESIVGLAGLNPIHRPDYLRQPAIVEVSRFYLDLDWIGYGAGSALMNHLLHQAAATGYRICWLRVWQGNKSAIQFYRRWNFKTIATDTFTAGDSLVPVWVMMHSLTASENTADIRWQ